MTITEAKAKRQNRTITLYLGQTLAEYEMNYLSKTGIQAVIRSVEIADSLDWGCLATGHKKGCPRQLRFTPHGHYTRWAKHFDGAKSLVTILRVECLDCQAVFSVQPSFIIRYKRYETDAIEKLMTLLFITEDSYRMWLGSVRLWALTANRLALGRLWKQIRAKLLSQWRCGVWYSG